MLMNVLLILHTGKSLMNLVDSNQFWIGLIRFRKDLSVCNSNMIYHLCFFIRIRLFENIFNIFNLIYYLRGIISSMIIILRYTNICYENFDYLYRLQCLKDVSKICSCFYRVTILVMLVGFG